MKLENFSSREFDNGTLINAKLEDVIPHLNSYKKFDIIIADPPYNIGKNFDGSILKTDIAE